MKLKWIINVILLILAVANSYAETTIFSDDFDNTNYISVMSNIKLTNSNAILSNYGENGVLYSIIITRSTNEKWAYLYLNYDITNTTLPEPKFNCDIYDDSDNKTKFTNLENIKYDISELTNHKIKLKATLIRDSASGKSTPLLKKWEITVTQKSSTSSIAPEYSNKFYAAPTPFKISDSYIRFYYSITEDSYITLEIYDVNYTLVKKIADDVKYSSGSYLDATWDGKNGAGISVYSGLYIAKLIVKDSNKNIKSTLTFPFAIIR